MQNKIFNEELSKIYWVDFVRVCAIFGVILLHVAARLVYKFNKIEPAYWWIGNIYDSAVRMSVPLFFMVTGFLLLRKTEPMREYAAKRFSRIFLPFLSWSVIYIFWRILYHHENISLLHAANEMVSTGTAYHLWFLYALMGLYLFIPILRIYVQNANEENLRYYIVLWFFSVAVIPFMAGIGKFLGKQISFGIDLSMMMGYSGYLVMGFMLGKFKISKVWIRFSVVLFVLGFLTTVFGAFFVTNLKQSYQFYFYEYLSPNVIIMAASSFVLLKHWGEQIDRNSRLLQVIQMFSAASFGIYLFHIIPRDLLSDGKLGFTLNAESGNPLYAIPLMALLVFLISFVFVKILSMVPLLRRIVL